MIAQSPRAPGPFAVRPQVCAAVGQGECGVHASTRFIYVAAAVGIAVAVLFIAPVVLMGASSAHADTNGYLRCIGSDAVAPLAPARDWLPSVRVIETDLDSADSPAMPLRKCSVFGPTGHRKVQAKQVFSADHRKGSAASATDGPATSGRC